MCWKAVCKAENDHLDKMLNDGSAETDVAGMSLNLSATNPELLSKLSSTFPTHFVTIHLCTHS